MAFQAFFGRCLRSSDEPSTATSRYMETMPQAMASGFQPEAKGTVTSASPKWT